MKKSKEHKTTQKKIVLTEASRDMFLSMDREGEGSEREVIMDILYALCDYLRYLYDEKEKLLKQEEARMLQKEYDKKKQKNAQDYFFGRRSRKWDV